MVRPKATSEQSEATGLPDHSMVLLADVGTQENQTV